MKLNIPVFAGQGTVAANNPLIREQALGDANSSYGSLLLSACHEAFHKEIKALTSTELQGVDIDASDFSNPGDLLVLSNRKYLHNPVITGTSLFLFQALRYLTSLPGAPTSKIPSPTFRDILERNLDLGVGILGFSSGMLPACVVGTSDSVITYISRSIEAFRLAFWIGVRIQIRRRGSLGFTTLKGNSARPWGVVVTGLRISEAEEAVLKFNKDNGLALSSVFLTAVMNDTCVTICGRPDQLAAFSTGLRVGVTVHQTTLDAIYHCPEHAGNVYQSILDDVQSRGIRFPDFPDIHFPIRSTLSGDLITPDTKDRSLLELVVDMILTQPVRWNVVVQQVTASVPSKTLIQLINVGPGSGLSRSLERNFSGESVTILDLSKGEDRSQKFRAKQEPVAIIGMAVNMPGAPNVAELWRVLEQGINTITEIPENRFKVSDYIEGRNPNRKMRAHTGNFLQNIDEFDNNFFNISPREAKSMDPQQRLLLHAAYEALEDSGYVPNATMTSNPDRFGCYIGAATHDYLQNLRNDIDVYYSTGTLKAFLSGRLSYAMNMSGPSVVVDTACSSSSVALYQGARALMNRDCDAAMVGGVNVITSPDMFLGLDRGHFLSPTGQCKAFDESADGYSRSEGCGMFVLKRLSDAIVENDKILGIVRGIEVNQSGNAHSITHPHTPTQTTLFKLVLKNSGMDMHQVNVVEAHGTGTQAGDPNELESIRRVFAIGRPPANPLHITSIKANTGHLEAASGAAGLAKLLLMLEHKIIPKQISLKNLNQRIAPLESDNTAINVESTYWPSHNGLPRVALLNNFGAAGSNTALLLEEYVQPMSIALPSDMPLVFGMSAKDGIALENLRKALLAHLHSSSSKPLRLADIAYTLTARRQQYSHRLAFSAHNRAELLERLPVVSAHQVSQGIARIGFVFSGQGGQYLGMGLSLYQRFPVFKKHIDECDCILQAHGFSSIFPIIKTVSQVSGLSTLAEFEAYQTAIFALQYGLCKVWLHWGIAPSVVAGHSLGEYAALVVAEVLSFKDALLLVAHRARLMAQKCTIECTGMLAVNLASTVVQAKIASSADFSSLSISCVNSDTDCVVSGLLSQLKRYKAQLDIEIHCKCVFLSVPFGCHSAAMNPLLEDFSSIAETVSLSSPCLPVISGVLGKVILTGDDTTFNSKYFISHCVQPVQFRDGLQSFLSSSSLPDVKIWIEIGPHTTTLPLLKANVSSAKDILLLASLRKQHNALSTLTASLVQLYNSNVKVKWRNTFSHIDGACCVSLPSYPFMKNKFWVDYRDECLATTVVGREVTATALSTEYSFLSSWSQYPSLDNGWVAKFETPIDRLAGYIKGHSVGGVPLCPASVYLEQVLAGIDLAMQHIGATYSDRHVVLREIEFVKPLVYDETIGQLVITSIMINGEVGTFTVGSVVDLSDELVHVHGEFRLVYASLTTTKFSRVLPSINRHILALIAPGQAKCPEVFSTRTAYEVIFPRVVEYSKKYQTMQSLVVDADGVQGYAKIKLPPDHDRGKFVVHPVFMDTLLHVAGFVANMQGRVNDAFICSEIHSVKVLPALVNNHATYAIFCNNSWLPDEGIMIGETYAVTTSEPQIIVAHLKGMHFRKVRLNSLKQCLLRASGKSTPAFSQRQLSSLLAKRPLLNSTDSIVAPTSSLMIHTNVICIVAETCDISGEELGLNTDLTSLGVDSLMLIEILSKLEQLFPRTEMYVRSFPACRTVGDIINEVSRQENVSPWGEQESYRPSSSGASSPRTLVHDEKLLELATLAICDSLDVKDILAAVLDLKSSEISDDTDLGSLGLDSLTSIEALQAIKAKFSVDLPTQFFSACHNIQQIHSSLAGHIRRRKFNKASRPSNLTIEPQAIVETLDITQPNVTHFIKTFRLDTFPVPIQNSTNERLPLFLIHDGSGLVNYYERLLSLGRTIWGINNPHFLIAKPWGSVVEMAAAYAHLIRGKTSGPLIIGGWSFGGVAAYEIALQLTKHGVHVKGVLLIDSPSPFNHVPLPDSVIESAIHFDRYSSDFELARLVRSQFAMNARMLEGYGPYKTEGLCPPLVLLRSKDGYNPPNVKDVPTWLSDRSNSKLATAGWESLASIQVLDIQGNHFTPFQPSNISHLSMRISEACDFLERA